MSSQPSEPNPNWQTLPIPETITTMSELHVALERKGYKVWPYSGEWAAKKDKLCFHFHEKSGTGVTTICFIAFSLGSVPHYPAMASEERWWNSYHTFQAKTWHECSLYFLAILSFYEQRNQQP